MIGHRGGRERSLDRPRQVHLKAGPGRNMNRDMQRRLISAAFLAIGGWILYLMITTGEHGYRGWVLGIVLAVFGVLGLCGVEEIFWRSPWDKDKDLR